MALDQYAPCPCGSGKKFKWCCQPIHVEIDKAFQQDADGQHEVALRTMEALTAQHADNPEAWGRKAELLYNSGKVEEAEASLQKAMDLNPKYPFGHLLRGSFRRAEGEITGALLLFRKAAEYYDPEATALLGQIYTLIFDCEMKLNHPVAARAAAQLALRYNPTAEDLRQGIEAVFGPNNPNLPEPARREYKFIPPPPSGERRAAWDSALAVGSGKLADAARAFEHLSAADPNDAPALYNLGLSHAWLGNNLAAVEALERYVVLESDEPRAAQAWALAEVLRCGQGMEDHADTVEYSVTIPLTDPQGFVNTLTALDKEGYLAGIQVREEENMLTGVLLEKPPPALTPELEARQNPRLGAFLALMGQMLRLWNVSKESLDRAHQLIRQRAGKAMGEPFAVRGPAKFFDVLSECLIFPHVANEEELLVRLRAHLETFFEEVWLHRPLKSLGQIPPIDAAGHPTLRKKLRGTILFLEDCARLTKFPYDFDRLRRKLNLLEGKPAAGEALTAAAGELDVKSMGTPELAALTVATMTDPQLDDAFQAALKLDARDLAGRFARELADRPARADKPDRFPQFQHLIQMAQGQGDFSGALDLVNEGEKDDCEHNEGRRRNDYELRRGQLLVKAGDFGQAQEIFDRLIARVPDDLRLRGSATEALLSAKQGGRALAYADQGLATARKNNQRDSEQYFLELQAAAKKQAGG